MVRKLHSLLRTPGIGLAGAVLLNAMVTLPALSQSPSIVRDSGRIRIVENGSLRVPEWRLSDAPELQLGQAHGGGPEEFYDVTDALLDDQGRLFVLDGGNAELRIFDAASGDHQLSVGRRGAGPGEFERPLQLWSSGDEVQVWDMRLRRLSVFGQDGELTRSLTLRNAPAGSEVVTVLANGNLIVKKARVGFPRGPRPEPIYSHFFLVDRDGALLETLSPHVFAYWGIRGDPPVTYQPLFTHLTQTAGNDSGYWVGTTEREEIFRYDGNGQLRLIIRWPWDGRTPSDDDVSAVRRHYEENLPRRVDQLDDRPVAQRFASHGRLVADQAGRLWVQKYRWPGDAGREWTIFDSSGVMIAQMTLPEADRMVTATEDRLVTVWSDAYEVQHVRIYRILR